MALEPESDVREVEQTESHSYRCPGCGGTVNGLRIEEVLAHHQHVLRPPRPPLWFERVATVASKPTAAAPKKTDHPLRVNPDETYGSPSPDRLRRYGHG